MLISFYETLMRASTPLLEKFLARRLTRGKEDAARANERRGKPTRSRGIAPLVWFHAASVGESLSLLSLISRLLKEHSQLQIMVTTGTVTSAKLMAERLPQGAFHQYMPVDHPDWVAGFLNHWRPDLVVWSESDLWPSMLRGIRQRNIPAVLLNARMSEKSFRCWKIFGGAAKEILSTFRLCLGQNEEEAARLKALGATSVRVSANLKYAAAPLPHDAEKMHKLGAIIGIRPAVLWASTHPGEEEYAIRLHQSLKTKTADILTIIVPRHPQRGGEVAGLAQKTGLTTSLRSKDGLPDKEIYVADTLGELGLFYRLVPLCIIGGSFVPVGGHNPIEPAQLGCQIFYGPHMFNFVSISEDFESRRAALRCANVLALEANVTEALRNPQKFAPMAIAAKDWASQQANAADEAAAYLSSLVTQITGRAAA